MATPIPATTIAALVIIIVGMLLLLIAVAYHQTTAFWVLLILSVLLLIVGIGLLLYYDLHSTTPSNNTTQITTVETLHNSMSTRVVQGSDPSYYGLATAPTVNNLTNVTLTPIPLTKDPVSNIPFDGTYFTLTKGTYIVSFSTIALFVTTGSAISFNLMDDQNQSVLPANLLFLGQPPPANNYAFTASTSFTLNVTRDTAKYALAIAVTNGPISIANVFYSIINASLNSISYASISQVNGTLPVAGTFTPIPFDLSTLFNTKDITVTNNPLSFTITTAGVYLFKFAFSLSNPLVLFKLQLVIGTTVIPLINYSTQVTGSNLSGTDTITTIADVPANTNIVLSYILNSARTIPNYNFSFYKISP